MKTEEAREVAEVKLRRLRALPYDDLVDRLLGRAEHDDVIGETGVQYQVEMMGHWDDRRHGHLRVSVSVDDGGWRTFAPLSISFIVAPDGALIDEGE